MREESVFWLWSFLGRLHPMLVHFPIGLICMAFLLDLISWRKKDSSFQSAIRLILMVASVSAILSVIAGLFLINSASYGSSILPIHQWVGIATLVLGSVATGFYYSSKPGMGRFFLISSMVSVLVTGHFGAALTHGEDYLTSVLPGNEIKKEESGGLIVNFASFQGPLTETTEQELNFQVRSILAHHCYSCHGAAKVKGELRLDKKEFVFAGGENGPVLIAGNAAGSELIRRVKLPRSHKEAMPGKGKGLSAEEIKLLEFWIDKGAPWPDGPVKSLYRVAELAQRLPELPPIEGRYSHPVDRIITAYFKKTKQQWPAPVEDRIFMKRVYLDLVGLLPNPVSIDSFISDKHPDKRLKLIQSLLDNKHAYSQHWLSFWNDLLRNDYTGTGYITGGRYDITKWLYNSLYTNKPYNEFVRELISPGASSQGFIKGIQWRGTINSSQSTEMQAAQNVSQVFLGLNLKCASCHDSFISDWKLEDSYAFANLFSDSILQIARCDQPTGKWADSRILYPQLGEIDKGLPKDKRLEQLADKLVQPEDGRLYRTLVNRIWAQLFGRGLVEPVDAMDNEPWNQDLLDWLAHDFVTSGYDIKKLLVTILTSQAYQAPSVTVKEPELLLSKDFKFKGMIRKRMTAEQFADAIATVFEPLYPDSVIVSNLLPDSVRWNMPFARAALVKNDPFLIALGRPARETVTTSRSSQANLIQALELTNGTILHEAVKRAAEKWKNKLPAEMIPDVYKKALGRNPTSDETDLAKKALGAKPDASAVQDFLWVMAMHPEFQLIY
ncbi:DUF1549 domain-containing protein [Flavihumibacter sp. UBA7668]|uniref:DUF1549 domain-containing protein n=1 Tax=Flavihumibacter sp. UBA7668 TaxID=1946542 RepID=UPI0032E4F3B4